MVGMVSATDTFGQSSAPGLVFGGFARLFVTQVPEAMHAGNAAIGKKPEYGQKIVRYTLAARAPDVCAATIWTRDLKHPPPKVSRIEAGRGYYR